MAGFHPILWLALVFGLNSLNLGMTCRFSLLGPVQRFLKSREQCQLSLDQSLNIARIYMCPFIWHTGETHKNIMWCNCKFYN